MRLILAAFAGLAIAAPAMADSIMLTGTVRDFKGQNEVGGHADFERNPGQGGFNYGLDRGIVANGLGGDGKPVYQASNVDGLNSTTGAGNFNQWFNDTAGVNLSSSLTLTANETAPGSGIYRYSNNSFFPLDGAPVAGQSYGNTPGYNHNYHFTFELNTQFTYQAGQSFSFTGDDDVWVFINNQLVIDLGGVHAQLTSSVNLDTLMLTAGQDYNLSIFFAERHTTESTFNFETSILLRNPVVPMPTPLGMAAAGLAALGFGPRPRRRA